jgi:hypothetical protein
VRHGVGLRERAELREAAHLPAFGFRDRGVDLWPPNVVPV